MQPHTLSPASVAEFSDPDVYTPEFWHEYWENVVTSDDTPVDGEYSEKQMRLLAGSVNSSWKGPGGGRSFLAFANVGLFHSPHEPPVVPDVMLSLDVERIPKSEGKKSTAYFIWVHGKPPDAVIEVVSNTEGDEDTRKLKHYERLKIPYYVIHDSDNLLKQGVLRILRLAGRKYQLHHDSWLPEIGLGLKLWKGSFEGWEETWLRWCDEKGRLLPTPEETLAAAAQAKNVARKARRDARKAQDDARKAQDDARKEADRASRLAEKLKGLGIDPNEI